MRVNRGLLGWGVFFIVLGSVPLAVRGGAIDAAAVRRAWELWPLVLVGIGLSLLLERTRLAIVGGLVVAVTFGVMGGALIASGIGGPIGISCGGGADRGEPFAEQRGSLGGDADVRLDLNCGVMHLSAADGTGWTVAGRSKDGLPPDIRSVGASVVVKTPEGSFGPLDMGWTWDVTLPRGAASRVNVSVNAGSATADLAGMQVQSLVVDVNAGDARIDLGGAASLGGLTGSVNAGSLGITLPRDVGPGRGELSVNAGSLELCVPAGTPLRIRAGDSPLGSNNYEDRGLVRSGSTWTSPGLSPLDQVVDLGISANLGSVTLNPEDGCD